MNVIWIDNVLLINLCKLWVAIYTFYILLYLYLYYKYDIYIYIYTIFIFISILYLYFQQVKIHTRPHIALFNHL